MATLYELTEEMMDLMDMMTEDPDSDCIKDSLESLEFELDAKAEGYCKVIKTLERKAEAAKAEKDRLADMQKTHENAAARLKGALLQSMIATNRLKIDGDIFKISARNTAESIDDESLPAISEIPEKYRIRQEDKIDKRLLLQDLKAGEDIAGIKLKRGKSLSIR